MKFAVYVDICVKVHHKKFGKDWVNIVKVMGALLLNHVTFSIWRIEN